jgi:hypothetical protein
MENTPISDDAAGREKAIGVSWAPMLSIHTNHFEARLHIIRYPVPVEWIPRSQFVHC